jgi:hypothetical protein
MLCVALEILAVKWVRMFPMRAHHMLRGVAVLHAEWAGREDEQRRYDKDHRVQESVGRSFVGCCLFVVGVFSVPVCAARCLGVTCSTRLQVVQQGMRQVLGTVHVLYAC